MSYFFGLIREKDPETSTTVIINNITETAVKLSAQAISNCTVNVNQSQRQVFDRPIIGTGRGVINLSQRAEATINQNCTQKAEVDAQLQQNVVTAIQQEAQAKGVDLAPLAQSTNATAETNIRNSLKADINMDSIINSVSNLSQDQLQEVRRGVLATDDSIINISQGLTAQVFLEQLSDTIKKNSVVQDIANQISQKAESETQSTIVGVVGGFFKMFGNLGVLLIIGLIIVACVAAYVMFGGSGGEERKNMLMQQMTHRMGNPQMRNQPMGNPQMSNQQSMNQPMSNQQSMNQPSMNQQMTPPQNTQPQNILPPQNTQPQNNFQYGVLPAMNQNQPMGNPQNYSTINLPK